MEIATKEQLRWAFLRRAAITVPLILLLGFGSSTIAPGGASNRWYAMLIKPAMTPPDWVFPVAWTALYVLMGLAVAMILSARGSRWRGIAILLFAGQLIANLVWSPLFFGAHQVGAALILLVAILVLATLATVAFLRVRRTAALLMLPYIAWLCFAAALNWQIDKLNPGAATLVPAAASTQIDL